MIDKQPTGQEPERKECDIIANKIYPRPVKQEPEYRITETWINELKSMHVSDARKREIVETVLSRSYSPAPERKPGCYTNCPFNDLCANDIEKIQEIERVAGQSERENFTSALKEWFELIRDQARNDEKHFDDLGKDYLYDRGKCAGVAIFIEQKVRRKIESLRAGKEPE